MRESNLVVNKRSGNCAPFGRTGRMRLGLCGMLTLSLLPATGGTSQGSGPIERISLSSHGVEADHASGRPAMSSDGRYVVFESKARNLVRDDANGVMDVFLRDLKSRRTVRVSRSLRGGDPNGVSGHPTVSGDGRFVAFQSEASNLVPGDTNGLTDVFLHDRKTGRTTRLSVSSAGRQGHGPSRKPALSADGRYIAFESKAGLGTKDANETWDVFVHDRVTGRTVRVSEFEPRPGGEPTQRKRVLERQRAMGRVRLGFDESRAGRRKRES